MKACPYGHGYFYIKFQLKLLINVIVMIYIKLLTLLFICPSISYPTPSSGDVIKIVDMWSCF